MKEKWFSHQSKVASFSKSALQRMQNYFHFHKLCFSCFDLNVTGRRIESAFNLLSFFFYENRKKFEMWQSAPKGNLIDWENPWLHLRV